jgi:hypothetical protein
MNTATMADVIDMETVDHSTTKPPAIQQQHAIAATTPAELLRIAIDKNADLDRLEKLMQLQERWEAKQAKRSYDDAFASFKAEAVVVMKGRLRKDGPLRGTSYAELHDVVDAVTPALSRHRLSSSWKVTKDEKDWIEVTCYLRHVDGHEESVSMGGPPDNGPVKNPVQARASTITYLERQTLKAACGVAEGGDDDDGGGGGSQGVGKPDNSRGDRPAARPANADQAQPTFYDQKKFDANKDTWREMVNSGRKTSAAMIQFIESKGMKLTEAQQNTIDSWSHEND